MKYVTLEGEGVREGVTVCDRGEGVQEHVTSHFKKNFIHMKPKIETDKKPGINPWPKTSVN